MLDSFERGGMASMMVEVVEEARSQFLPVVLVHYMITEWRGLQEEVERVVDGKEEAVRPHHFLFWVCYILLSDDTSEQYLV